MKNAVLSTIAAATKDLPPWRVMFRRKRAALLRRISACQGSGSRPASDRKRAGSLRSRRNCFAAFRRSRKRCLSAGVGSSRQLLFDQCVDVGFANIKVLPLHPLPQLLRRLLLVLPQLAQQRAVHLKLFHHRGVLARPYHLQLARE